MRPRRSGPALAVLTQEGMTVGEVEVRAHFSRLSFLYILLSKLLRYFGFGMKLQTCKYTRVTFSKLLNAHVHQRGHHLSFFNESAGGPTLALLNNLICVPTGTDANVFSVRPSQTVIDIQSWKTWIFVAARLLQFCLQLRICQTFNKVMICIKILFHKLVLD